MKALLILSRISVENANAISGLTYGFPAISNFLGFTHRLSRLLVQQYKLPALGGCAIICHHHQIHKYQPTGWGDHVFALTRNPLTKEGKAAPFNEEARMHMTVSLAIECDFDKYDLEDKEIIDIEGFLKEQIYKFRLAGGIITNIKSIKLELLQDENQEMIRKRITRSLLPGFLIIDRNELLKSHYEQLKTADPETELLDAWLDFYTLKYKSEEKMNDNSQKDKLLWRREPKPLEDGWFVPIMVGYKAISPLYENGEVACTRDSNTPFRFVEPIYSVGQWLSPHRIRSYQAFRRIFWRYHFDKDYYLSKNDYQEID